MHNPFDKNSPTAPEQSELGKASDYDLQYNPGRLFAIPRSTKRSEIGVLLKPLPFFGFDCWNHYEVSWLNEKGKPVVAMATIIYDCTTPNIVESKSLKLYFNSFNNVAFDEDVIKQFLKRDLSACVGGEVEVNLYSLNRNNVPYICVDPSGTCLDDLDISCSVYHVEPNFLTIKNVGHGLKGKEMPQVEETVYSNLLKSNCLVTNQPDWGTVQISYTGHQMHHAGLLQYLVSFRNHNEFHEQCIERIFVDIMAHCKPAQLTVYGRYTRRGGLDINPYRSTKPLMQKLEANQRLIRQ